jgi:hypothetical protein
MKEEFATSSAAGDCIRAGTYFRGQLMRAYVLGICSFLLAAGGVEAQVPRSADSNRAVDATIGNKVLQLRYLTRSPLGAAKSDLDYGLLVTENNDLIGSAALMFETDLDQVPRLRLEIGPQAYLARLVTQQKTDVFALAADFTAGVELRFASRLTGMAGYRWMKFTLVNQPDIKVTNELFAGLRWRLD